jgi:hypothetical protein
MELLGLRPSMKNFLGGVWVLPILKFRRCPKLLGGLVKNPYFVPNAKYVREGNPQRKIWQKRLPNVEPAAKTFLGRIWKPLYLDIRAKERLAFGLIKNPAYSPVIDSMRWGVWEGRKPGWEKIGGYTADFYRRNNIYMTQAEWELWHNLDKLYRKSLPPWQAWAKDPRSKDPDFDNSKPSSPDGTAYDFCMEAVVVLYGPPKMTTESDGSTCPCYPDDNHEEETWKRLWNQVTDKYNIAVKFWPETEENVLKYRKIVQKRYNLNEKFNNTKPEDIQGTPLV